ncbi:siderophore-interacting protein [Nocardioides dilutus]
MTVTFPHLGMLLEEVEVRRVERLSPSFARFELGSPAFAELGCDGPTYDQRIKLVLPHEHGPVPSFEGADDSWWDSWLARPVEERGHLRTYTVRAVVGSGEDTRLVVDIVLHDDHDGGKVGPGSAWASRAKAGDRLVVMAPRRGHPYGGIEFAPGEARRVMLVGDETAVPAIAGILRDLPADATGTALLEVPLTEDVQDLVAPPGMKVRWLPRDRRPLGSLVHAAALETMGVAPVAVEVGDDEVDPDLWETPTYSSSGEAVGTDWASHDDLYVWIAGESKVVTGLRRVLVRDLGLDRRQVAFMGYWRLGVSMA